jgi:hypothetical protein
MTVKERWYVAAAISLPLTCITVYLLWIWPRPRGTPAWVDVIPYLVSLLTGLPFVWALARGRGRVGPMLAFLAGGFVILWIYALAVLCGVRDVCL